MQCAEISMFNISFQIRGRCYVAVTPSALWFQALHMILEPDCGDLLSFIRKSGEVRGCCQVIRPGSQLELRFIPSGFGVVQVGVSVQDSQVFLSLRPRKVSLWMLLHILRPRHTGEWPHQTEL